MLLHYHMVQCRTNHFEAGLPKDACLLCPNQSAQEQEHIEQQKPTYYRSYYAASEDCANRNIS
jgi:hypothetical protein